MNSPAQNRTSTTPIQTKTTTPKCWLRQTEPQKGTSPSLDGEIGL